MYDTSGSYSVCYASPTDADLAQRLIWLRAEIARDEARLRKPARVADEWRALRAVRLGQPLTTREAYAWFGMFLGLFPPFALFARLAAAFLWHTRGRLATEDTAIFWVLLFLAMNAVCCLVGRKFGGFLGRELGDPGGRSWPVFVLYSMLMGIPWALITGGAGGAVGFGVGAFFGIAFAVPIAVAAFPAFAILHRLLSRGGMIEEQHLWPLAFGVPLVAAALVLGWGIH
jgi:hypothetical protein